MKFFTLLFVTLFFFNYNLAQQGPDRIKVKGNSFVDQKGDTIVFRGLSSSDPDKLENDGMWERALL